MVYARGRPVWHCECTQNMSSLIHFFLNLLKVQVQNKTGICAKMGLLQVANFDVDVLKSVSVRVRLGPVWVSAVQFY